MTDWTKNLPNQARQKQDRKKPGFINSQDWNIFGNEKAWVISGHSGLPHKIFVQICYNRYNHECKKDKNKKEYINNFSMFFSTIMYAFFFVTDMFEILSNAIPSTVVLFWKVNSMS